MSLMTTKTLDEYGYDAHRCRCGNSWICIPRAGEREEACRNVAVVTNGFTKLQLC